MISAAFLFLHNPSSMALWFVTNRVRAEMSVSVPLFPCYNGETQLIMHVPSCLMETHRSV